MRIFRRWFEFLMLFYGALAIGCGIDLPPPVASIHVLSGPVEQIQPPRRKRSLAFTVQGKHLYCWRSSAEQKRVLARLREGMEVRVHAWTGWGEEHIVTLEAGGKLLLRKRSLAFDWLVNVVIFALGLTLIGLAIASLRSSESAWERHKRIQLALRERQLADHSTPPKPPERKPVYDAETD